MKYSVLVVAAATGALASLNCTTTASIKTYCCPDANSEVVKESPAGALIMTGCAADDTNKEYYWNYNGLYTPYTKDVKDCNLNGRPYADLKVLPVCAEDTFVLQMTMGKSSPLDECNPKCVSEDSFPEDVYYGDRQKETNMAADFPAPKAPPPMQPPTPPASASASASAPAAASSSAAVVAPAPPANPSTPAQPPVRRRRSLKF